jgi:hypothetical protein
LQSCTAEGELGFCEAQSDCSSSLSWAVFRPSRAVLPTIIFNVIYFYPIFINVVINNITVASTTISSTTDMYVCHISLFLSHKVLLLKWRHNVTQVLW